MKKPSIHHTEIPYDNGNVGSQKAFKEFGEELDIGPYYRRYVSLNELTLSSDLDNLTSNLVSLNDITDVKAGFFDYSMPNEDHVVNGIQILGNHSRISL